MAAQKKEALAVEVTRLGYYDGQRRREGEKFVLETDQHFSERWMKPLYDRAKAQAEEKKRAELEAKVKAELEAAEAEAPVAPEPEAEPEHGKKKKKGTGDAEVL